jgi:hypothetical protein
VYRDVLDDELERTVLRNCVLLLHVVDRRTIGRAGELADPLKEKTALTITYGPGEGGPFVKVYAGSGSVAAGALPSHAARITSGEIAHTS